MSQYDCVVIGAGFGGLGAAMQLAECGARVLLLEALKYAGGCAATFKRGEYRFEAGATLFSGFEDGQLFHQWQQRYRWPIQFQKLDPIIYFRSSNRPELAVPPSREALCAEWIRRHPEHTKGLSQFFALQARVADALWPIFDSPHRLPPMTIDGFQWHGRRLHHYPQFLWLINTPLIRVLKRYQLDTLAPFVEYCNAICQITIQTSVFEAEAPFALSTLDYLFRGTGHIHGGIGELTEAMLNTLRDLGVDILLSTRARRLVRHPNGWDIEARGNRYSAHAVIANLTPHALSNLLDETPKKLTKLAHAVESGWGAAMLYLSVQDHPNLPRKAAHIQCINDPNQPLESGNHIFCSLSSADETGRAPRGFRTATVSTHVPIADFQAPQEDTAEKIQSIQDKMRRTLAQQIPELSTQIHSNLSASPRTFERFTQRTHGFVGGVPRRTGFQNYSGLFPTPVLPNLWMVGDSVFPGQSTLATAVGGCRTANAMLKKINGKRTKDLRHVAQAAQSHS